MNHALISLHVFFSLQTVDGKTRQSTVYKSDLEETMSLTLPRSGLHNKKKIAPDSLSLVNEPGALPHGPLARNIPLSSSLQDISQKGRDGIILGAGFKYSPLKVINKNSRNGNAKHQIFRAII